MPPKTSKDLKQMLQPYLFVLKEGKSIKEDLLDYSLLMLHVHCMEVIKKQPGLPNQKKSSDVVPDNARSGLAFHTPNC